MGTVFAMEVCQLPDADATRALGRRLAEGLLAWGLAPPPLLLLQGDLGAGKTCLVQGLAEGLGIHEPITSPTFALAHHYRGEAGVLRPAPGAGGGSGADSGAGAGVDAVPGSGAGPGSWTGTGTTDRSIGTGTSAASFMATTGSPATAGQTAATGPPAAAPASTPSSPVAATTGKPSIRVPTALVHLDLYRLEQPAAAAELFAQEEEEARALGAVLAVEWPERLSVVPEPCWRVELEVAGEGRVARLFKVGISGAS